MSSLLFLLLTAGIPSTTPRVAVVDAVHSRISHIVQTALADDLRTHGVDVADDGAYVLEITSASDAGGKGRNSQIVRDMTHSVEVTELVGGAAAEIVLYDSARAVVATYKLSGSGSSSIAVGGRHGDVITSFVLAPFMRRSRSAEAARAIGHDVAVQAASVIRERGTPLR